VVVVRWSSRPRRPPSGTGSAGGKRPSVELRAGLRAVDHAGAGALGEAADARRDRLGEQGGAKAARITDFFSRSRPAPRCAGSCGSTTTRRPTGGCSPPTRRASPTPRRWPRAATS